jgi:hypothetical protein
MVLVDRFLPSAAGEGCWLSEWLPAGLTEGGVVLSRNGLTSFYHVLEALGTVRDFVCGGRKPSQRAFSSKPCFLAGIQLLKDFEQVLYIAIWMSMLGSQNRTSQPSYQ